MKTSSLFLGLLTLSAAVAASGQTTGTTMQSAGIAPYSVAEKGPNYRIWQSPGRKGYTELAPGMNYQRNGQWLESKETIVPMQTGGAAAVQGQHQVYFPYDIGKGAVTLYTPSNQKMDSRPLGISYSDKTNTVLIAGIGNSTGQILPSGNKVLYPQAFTGLGADLLCIYHKDSYESDVVFHQRLPSPAEFGLDPTNAWLQIWTEFYSSNSPEVSYDPGVVTNLSDPYLEFGGMRMVHGRAFMLLQTNMTLSDDLPGFRVKKTWVRSGDRRFLLEEVPYALVQDALQDLPSAPPSNAVNPGPRRAHGNSELAWMPPRRPVVDQTNVMQIALETPRKGPEFVMDYLMLNSSQASYVFHGDTTYLISGSVYLNGNTIFEGGAVIKYTNFATIYNSGNIAWQGDAYHPVVFTSMHDDTVGQKITGSTGTPVTMNNTFLYNQNYYAGMELKYVRFKYAGIGIQSYTWLALWHSQFIKCSQALRPMAYFDINGTSSGGYLTPYWGVALFNDLFSGCGTAVNLDDGATANYLTAYPPQGVDLYFTAQNVTSDQTTNFLSLAPPTSSGGCCGGCGCGGCFGGYSCFSSGCCGGTIYYPVFISSDSHALLTNCLFTSVTQSVQTSLINTIGAGSGTRGYNNSIIYPYASPNFGCGFGADYQIATSPYQPTVAGNYYLSAASGYKNIGSNSVRTNLLSDLQKKTTDAPNASYASNTWSSANFLLQPTVSRDTNTLDIGYHYDPIDYLFCELYLTNSSVVVSNGTVIGFGNDVGIVPQGGSQLISQGAPDQRNYFVHYNSVQEQTVNWGSYGLADAQAISPYHPDGNTAPTVTLRLSTIVAPNGATNVIYQPGGSYSAGVWSLQDSEIYGSGGQLNISIPTGGSAVLKNNLFKYCNMQVVGTGGLSTWNNLFTTVYSNALYQASFTNNGTATWTNFDNAFDRVAVNLTGVYSNSAYLNQAVVNSTKQGSDITTNLTWISGPLGGYYQASTSPLVNRGSRTADKAGLYHYTVTTNLVSGLEIKETNSVVDMGYHYVAVTNSGAPIDTDGDGLPDYYEDVNGNGVYDGGDTANWTNASTDGSGMSDGWELKYFGHTGVDPNADYDYDGNSNLHEFQAGTDPTNPASITQIQLGGWPFDNTNTWVGSSNQIPLVANNVFGVSSWDSNAVHINFLNATLKYRDAETNGNANVNLRNGTIALWFKPDWTSASLGGSGPGSAGRLIELGSYNPAFTNGWWALYLKADGNQVIFGSSTNGSGRTNLVATAAFSNQWSQLVLTYTPTNSSLYLNGQVVTNGLASTYFPSLTERTNGFRIGSDAAGTNEAKGLFEDLQTFNYPLSAAMIASNYQAMLQQDKNGNGLPDMWEMNNFGRVGVDPFGDPDGDDLSNLQEYQNGTNPNQFDPAKLGWWHFDNAPIWSDVSGLLPSTATGIFSEPSWSGNAAWLGTSQNSVLAYPYQRTNGSVVVGLPVGSIRFWFKPDWSSNDGNQSQGPGDTLRLFEMGRQTTNANYGWLGLTVDPLGSTLTFSTEANGIHTDNATCLVNFNSQDWYQITVTYNATNSYIYVNGQYVVSWAGLTNSGLFTNGYTAIATGTGLTNLPSLGVLQAGFHLGSSWDGVHQANGRFEELETFNYCLSSNSIATNYLAIMSADSNGDGVPNVTKDAFGARYDTADSDCDGLPDAWEIAHGLNPNDASDASMEMYLGYAGGSAVVNVPVINQVSTVAQTNLVNISFVTDAGSMAGQSVNGGVVAGLPGHDTWNFCDSHSDYVHGVPLLDSAGNSLNAQFYAYLGPCNNFFTALPPYDMGWDLYQFSAANQTDFLFGYNAYASPFGWYGEWGWNLYGDWWDYYGAVYCFRCPGSPWSYTCYNDFWLFYNYYWSRAYALSCTYSPWNYYFINSLYFDPWLRPNGYFYYLPWYEQYQLVGAINGSSAYARDLAMYIEGAGLGGHSGGYAPFGCVRCYLPPFSKVQHDTNSLDGTDGAVWTWSPQQLQLLNQLPLYNFAGFANALYPDAQRTLLISGLPSGQYAVNVYYDCPVPTTPATVNGMTSTALSARQGTRTTTYWHTVVNTENIPAATDFNSCIMAPTPPWAENNGGNSLLITSGKNANPFDTTPGNDVKLLGIQIVGQSYIVTTNGTTSAPVVQGRPLNDAAYLLWGAAGNDTVYNVYRAIGATNNTWTLLASVTNQFNYQDNGLLAGTNYFYKVAGVETNGTVDPASTPLKIVPFSCAPPLPPRLDYVTTLKVPNTAGAYGFNGQTLFTNSDAYDPQGLPLQFVVERVTSGSLLINGSPYSVANSTFATADSVVWTPPVGVLVTNLPAFYVHVYDGINRSSNSVPVQFQQPAPLHLYSWGDNYAGKVGNGYIPTMTCVLYDTDIETNWSRLLPDELNMMEITGLWNVDPRWKYSPGGYYGPDPSYLSYPSPQQVLDGDGITSISGSEANTIGIDRDGNLRVWGRSWMDAFGGDYLFGRPMVRELKEMETSEPHFADTNSDFSIYSWQDPYVQAGLRTGTNFFGFLPLDFATPVKYLGPISHPVKLTLNTGDAFFAVTDDGNLLSWGVSDWAWLGRDPLTGQDKFHDDSIGMDIGVYPEPVFSDGVSVVEICGDQQSGILCRRLDGSVWWWGQLTGEYFTGALDPETGLPESASKNYYLTDGSDNTHPHEVTSLEGSADPIVQMSAANQHFVILRASGAVSEMGGLASLVPTDFYWYGLQIAPNLAALDAAFATNQPVAVAGLPTNVCQVAASGTFGIALTTDGNVWIWGLSMDLIDFDYYGNDYFDIWKYTQDHISTNTAPRQLTGLRKIVKVRAAGYQSLLALDQSGSVWGWGYNSTTDPIIGDSASSSPNGYIFQPDPERIPGLANVKDIYVNTSDLNHTTAYALGTAATGMPDGLKATPMDGQVKLSWSIYPGTTYYIVYRSMNEDAGYVAVGNASGNTFADQGPLQNGQTYYYRITSVVNGVESSPSWDVAATPFPTPTPVQNLSAALTCHGVILQWQAPSNVVASPVQTYLVKSGNTILATLYANSTNYYDPYGLLGQCYSVAACNSAGQPTNQVCVSASNSIPCPPAPLVADNSWLQDTNADPADDMLVLQWAGPINTPTNADCWNFQTYEFPDDGLINQLANGGDTISASIWAQFNTGQKTSLTNLAVPLASRLSTLTNVVNPWLAVSNSSGVNGSIYTATAFSGVTLRPATSNLLHSTPVPTGAVRVRLNRMLLDDYYNYYAQQTIGNSGYYVQAPNWGSHLTGFNVHYRTVINFNGRTLDKQRQINLGLGDFKYFTNYGSLYGDLYQYHWKIPQGCESWASVAAVVDGVEGDISSQAGPTYPVIPDNVSNVWSGTIRAVPGYKQIYLDWQDSDSMYSWDVYFSTNSTVYGVGNWAPVPGGMGLQINRCWHTGLLVNSNYSYEVVATLLDDSVVYSPVVTAQVLAAPAPTMTNFTAKASAYDAMVLVEWKVPKTNLTDPDIINQTNWQFFVERKPSAAGDSSYTLATGSGFGLAYLDTDVTDGNSYTYRVTAFDTAFNRLQALAGLNGSTNTSITPTATNSLTLLPPKPGNGFIDLTWSPIRATRFTVEHSLSTNGPFEVVATLDAENAFGNAQNTYRHIGLQNGVMHYYQIVAVTPTGFEIDSPILGAMPLATLTPLPPQQFQGTLHPGDTNVVVLSWLPETAVNDFQLYLQDQSQLTLLYEGPAVSAGYTVPDTATTNDVFTFAVRAVNNAGLASDFSFTTVSNQAPDDLSGVPVVQPIMLQVAGWMPHGTNVSLTVTGPTNLALNAVVSVPFVQEVSFYDSGTLLGTVSEPPYQYNWNHVPGGSHSLSASVQAKGGNSSSLLNGGGATFVSDPVPVVVNVMPELSAYETSATDLQLPAVGMPISVGRSYSSRNTNSDVSLGMGWVADWNLPTLTLSTNLGYGWGGIVQANLGTPYYYISDAVGHFVTVSLPGGSSVGFAPQLNYYPSEEPYNYATVDGGTEMSMSYEPFDVGQGTLQSDGVGSITIGNVSDTDTTWPSGFLAFDGMAPTIFTYMAANGTKYYYGQQRDAVTWLLTSVKDRTGNMLNYAYGTSDTNDPAYSPRTAGRLMSIRNSGGRQVTFAYPSTNEVDVMDMIGTNAAVKYLLTNGKLTQVLRLVSRANSGRYETNTYSYGSTGHDQNRLTDFYDARGVRMLHNIYTNSVNGGDDGDMCVQISPGHTNLYSVDTDLNLTVKGVTATATNTARVASDSSGAISGVTVPVAGTTPSTNASQSAYDSHGNVVSQTDANGNTKTFQYDDQNRLIGQSDANGNTTTVTLNDFGQPSISIDANGKQTLYTYDAVGNIVNQRDPAQVSTDYEYYKPLKDVNRSILVGELPSSEAQTVPGVPCQIVTLYTYQTNSAVGVLGDMLSTTLEWVDTKGVVMNTPVTTSYTYDSNGNRLTEIKTRTVAGGIQTIHTAYYYDAQNRVTNTVMWADGAETMAAQTNLVTYNSLGTQFTSTDAAGHVTTNIYDFNGNLIETAYPDGTVSRIAYDGFGRQQYVQDRAVPSSNVTTAPATRNTYDASGRVAKTERCEAVQLTRNVASPGTDFVGTTNEVQFKMTVNSAGTVLTTTRTFYDIVGRAQYLVSARGAVTESRYDAAGRRTNELVHATYYNPTNEVPPSLSDSVQSTSYTYDANGNQLTVTDAAGHTTTSVYDDANRVTEVDYPSGNGTASRYTYYDGLGRKIQEADEAGVATAYTYDFRGLLTSVTLAYGTTNAVTTVYSYDELGNEIQQLDAAGHATTFRYDALGRRTGRTLPGNQSQGFAYDLSGNQIYGTNFNGIIITNRYDWASGRLTNCSSIGYKTTYTYNSSGLPTNMVDASGTTAFYYNDLNEVTNKTVVWNGGPTITLQYGYDALGGITNIQSSTANGVNLVYNYDLLGRITNVLVNGSSVAGYGFDIVGNLQAMRYGNGVTNLYQYDSRNRLTNLVWKLNSTSLANFSYTVGVTGIRTSSSETLNGTARTYAWNYDSLYRLTSETIQNVGTLNYSFDAVGNRTNRTSSVTGIANQSPTYNANDWMTSSDMYDSNGNTTNSSGNAYQYDVLNHLTNVNNGAIVIGYDGVGNRVSKKVGTTTTYYLVDNGNPSGYAQVLEEWTSTGTPALSRVYNYGFALISQRQAPSGTVSYYGADGHGSVRFLANTSGAITDTRTYDAFGLVVATSGSTPNNYLYCGEQLDGDLGMYYLRARYYKPDSGRFWTMDTYAGGNQDPSSLHKYLYCHGDPINNFDPSGNFKLSLGAVKWLREAFTRMKRISAIDLFLRIWIGMAVDDRLGAAYIAETGSSDVVLDRWIGRTTDTDLPSGNWLANFALRPDILDRSLQQVLDIKPDNRWSIALGEAQIAGYIAALGLRYPGKVYTPGLWAPAFSPYDVPVVPGISGLSVAVTARNAGGGVIAYEISPSPEVLATEVELAYEVAKVTLVRVAEGARVVQEWATAVLIDCVGGFAF